MEKRGQRLLERYMYVVRSKRRRWDANYIWVGVVRATNKSQRADRTKVKAVCRIQYIYEYWFGMMIRVDVVMGNDVNLLDDCRENAKRT